MVLDDYIRNDVIFDDILDSLEQEEKMLENKRKELKKIKHKILEGKILLYNEFSKYSTFDADLIGNRLAGLMTDTKGEDYKYITCMIKAKKYSGYDYVSKQNEYVSKEIPVRIIVPLKQALVFDGIVDIEDFRKLILDNYVIVLDKNEHDKFSENINFYNDDYCFNLNCPFENENAIHYFDMPLIEAKDYRLIKNCIDEDINCRIQKDVPECSDELVEENSNVLDDDLKRSKLISSIKIEEMIGNNVSDNGKVLKKEKR